MGRVTIGFLVLFAVLVLEARKSNKKIGPGKTIQMTCKKQHVISGLDMHAYANGTTCKGLPHDLLVERANCFWKQACNISLSADVLIVYPIGNKYDCLGKKAISLEVVRKETKCVKEDSKFVLCDHTAEISSTSGMIVSHKAYPWQYPGGLNCSLTLKGQNGKEWVTFTFHSIDIDYPDNLTIGEQSVDSEDRDAKLGDMTLPGGEDVRIHFNVMRDTKSGKGFIICFKYHKEGDKISDACKKLASKIKYIKDKKKKEKGTRKRGGKRGGKRNRNRNIKNSTIL